VTEKLLTNSQQQKKALMQQLLTGKKRLLDENGVRFSGEWQSLQISDIGTVVTGSTPRRTTVITMVGIYHGLLQKILLGNMFQTQN
jgi:restriction endonuclease S subunit